jgi:hypothetical protein
MSLRDQIVGRGNLDDNLQPNVNKTLAARFSGSFHLLSIPTQAALAAYMAYPVRYAPHPSVFLSFPTLRPVSSVAYPVVLSPPPPIRAVSFSSVLPPNKRGEHYIIPLPFLPLLSGEKGGYSRAKP